MGWTPPKSGWGSLANYSLPPTQQQLQAQYNADNAANAAAAAAADAAASAAQDAAWLAHLDALHQQHLAALEADRAAAERAAAEASAMDRLRRFFAPLGMAVDAELEQVLLNAMRAGYTDADLASGLLMPEIQATQSFKTRFPGYAARIANGYNAISIQQYLDLENQYRSIMENAGLPRGFYDDPADMGQWIAKNVSPAEIEGRVRLATTAAKQVDPTMRNLMSRFYGLTTGDVAAYFLDPNRALPTIEHQYKSAEVASWAERNGYHVGDMARYEKLAADGITGEQAAQGYGTIRQLDQTVGRVASVYGESYSQDDAEQDVFYNKNEKRQRIMRQEAATFGGSSRGATGSAQRSNY